MLQAIPECSRILTVAVSGIDSKQLDVTIGMLMSLAIYTVVCVCVARLRPARKGAIGEFGRISGKLGARARCCS